MPSVATLLSVLALAWVPAGAAAKASSGSAGCKQTNALSFLAEPLPSELPGALETGVLSRFALFRRQATSADALPPLNAAGSELEGHLSSYYPASIRQLAAAPNGARWFLVPGFLHVAEVPPARCLSGAQRRERPKLVQREQSQRTQPAYCLVEVGGSESGAEGDCSLFSEVAGSSAAFASSLSEGAVAVLVPDGVASVRVSYAHVPPLLLPVSENGYVLETPSAVRAEQHRLGKKVEHRLAPLLKTKHPSKKLAVKILAKLLRAVFTIAAETAPTRIEWLSATGSIVQTTRRPHEVVRSSAGSAAGASSALESLSELAIRPAR
jgi:hypothetical protein